MKKNLNPATPVHRSVAYIIDKLILWAFGLPLSYLNLTFFNSFAFFLLITLLMVCYKPVTEFYFKKTLGKHLLNLEIITEDGQKLTLYRAFIRNIFFILPVLATIPFYYSIFNNTSILILAEASYRIALSEIDRQYPFLSTVSNILSMLIVIDFVYYLSTLKSTKMALHDHFVNTQVVAVPKVKEEMAL